jgi:hypothetical protein
MRDGLAALLLGQVDPHISQNHNGPISRTQRVFVSGPGRQQHHGTHLGKVLLVLPSFALPRTLSSRTRPCHAR